MAVYKVPQDVESEDHLIGPFGMRQFIYLIIVAGAGFVAYFLYSIFPPLFIIPLPIMIFFFLIAMPLRKDQPTEVYLMALLKYNLGSKKRMWVPDGAASTVQITAPKHVDDHPIKDLTEDEAVDRLDRLAQIVDTRGWAVRGVYNPDINSMGNVQFNEEVAAEANAAPDIMDDTNTRSQAVDQLIIEQQAISKQAAVSKMARAQQVIAPDNQSQPTTSTPPAIVDNHAHLVAQAQANATTAHYNPYPDAIRQRVISPISASPAPSSVVTSQPEPIPAQKPETTSEISTPPDILDSEYAKSSSVKVLAEQLHRKEDKLSEEVEIRLH